MGDRKTLLALTFAKIPGDCEHVHFPAVFISLLPLPGQPNKTWMKLVQCRRLDASLFAGEILIVAPFSSSSKHVGTRLRPTAIQQWPSAFASAKSVDSRA